MLWNVTFIENPACQNPDEKDIYLFEYIDNYKIDAFEGVISNSSVQVVWLLLFKGN